MPRNTAFLFKIVAHVKRYWYSVFFMVYKRQFSIVFHVHESCLTKYFSIDLENSLSTLGKSNEVCRIFLSSNSFSPLSDGRIPKRCFCTKKNGSDVLRKTIFLLIKNHFSGVLLSDKRQNL